MVQSVNQWISRSDFRFVDFYDDQNEFYDFYDFYDVPFPDISSGFSILSQHFRQMFLKRFGCRLQHEITPAFLSLSPHFHLFSKAFLLGWLGARGFTTGANASPRSSMTTAMALLNSMSSEAKPKRHGRERESLLSCLVQFYINKHYKFVNICILLIIVMHVCMYIYI